MFILLLVKGFLLIYALLSLVGGVAILSARPDFWVSNVSFWLAVFNLFCVVRVVIWGI